MRTVSVVGLLVILVHLLPPVAAAGSNRHPHFDDRGTLNWHTSLPGALATARREAKVVLVVLGHQRSAPNRTLCSCILPGPRVRARVGRVAVGLAVDWNGGDRNVMGLFRRHLPGARALPYVAFLASDGSWITGYSGPTSEDDFLRHLHAAEVRAGGGGRPSTPGPTAPQSRSSCGTRCSGGT